jgi:hypothetical protein
MSMVSPSLFMTSVKDLGGMRLVFSTVAARRVVLVVVVVLLTLVEKDVAEPALQSRTRDDENFMSAFWIS